MTDTVPALTPAERLAFLVAAELGRRGVVTREQVEAALDADDPLAELVGLLA